MPMKCITASIPLSAGIAREGLASPQVARRPEGWRTGAGFLLLRRCGRLCRAGPEAGAVRQTKGRPVFADIAARWLWGGGGGGRSMPGGKGSGGRLLGDVGRRVRVGNVVAREAFVGCVTSRLRVGSDYAQALLAP